MQVVHGTLSWKRSTVIMVSFAVFGTLSWFAGLFTVVVGLSMALFMLYAKRFDADNLQRSRERKTFVIGRERWEIAGCMLLGSTFGVGLKYGFSQSQMITFAYTFISFIPIMVAEIFWICLRLNGGETKSRIA